MHTRASNSELVEPLSDPERTLNRRLRRQNKRVPFEQRDKRPTQPRIVYLSILDINYFCHFLDILKNYNPMDDEPMWAADRVVALTPGSTITIPETANEFANKDTFMELKTKFETTTKNHQASIQNLEAKSDRLADKQSGRTSGSLPSNTQPNPKVIMEYLVNFSKKARILELKRRHLKINVLTTNTPYPSRKIWRICACTSQKTTKETRSIRRIQGRPIRHIQAMEIKYSGRYQTWKWISYKRQRKQDKRQKTEHGMETTVQNQGQSPKLPNVRVLI
ncbi:hypothetical protein Tco_0493460 [Tanacetum coccineum]